jgi:hypothetical protein
VMPKDDALRFLRAGELVFKTAMDRRRAVGESALTMPYRQELRRRALNRPGKDTRRHVCALRLF